VSPVRQSSPLTTKDVPSSECPVRAEQADGYRTGRHLEPVAVDELVVPRNVIGMPVRHEQMRRAEAVAVDGLDERLERSAAVDEEGGPGVLVGHEVGVREPRRMHAPHDEHREIVAQRASRGN